MVFRLIDDFLNGKNKTQIIIICLLLILILGIVDYLSGYELSFSVFYLAPVAIASWYVGSNTGFIIALVSAIVWLIADYESGHLYSKQFIIFWNALVRLGFFTITYYLLSRIRTDFDSKVLQSRMDSLTGVMNLRAFEENYDKIARISTRYNRPISLGYIDVDNFKNINDSLGHSAGDVVLKDIAYVLSTSVRKTDFICRLGGDEFAIMLPETNYEGSQELFVKLRDRLMDLAVNIDIGFGVSIGVGIFQDSIPSLKEALKFADELMYTVKKSGKNDIVYRVYS